VSLLIAESLLHAAHDTCTLQVSLTEPMSKAFIKFCDRMGVRRQEVILKFAPCVTLYCFCLQTSLNAVKFFCDGQRLNESSTPASLDVEEDDECQIGKFCFFKFCFLHRNSVGAQMSSSHEEFMCSTA
jgi:hypothetical protein